VFGEPQFEPALIAAVIEGTPARPAVLDPLGADLKPGAEAYFTLMRNLAKSLKDCLAPAD
jgi:zinc transport system substrate-binding protein